MNAPFFASRLSSRRRWISLGLLAVDLVVTGVVLLLLLTEPRPLPARTLVAFLGLLAVGVAWAVVLARTLRRGCVFFAPQRVLAAGVAVLASAAFTLSAVSIMLTRGSSLLTVAGGTIGLVVTGVAVAALLIERRRYVRLLREREELSSAIL